MASLSGTVVSITTKRGSTSIVSADFSTIADGGGNGFATSAATMAYLAAQFAMLPPVGDTFSMPLRSAANVFGGYALMYAGAGAVEHAVPSQDGYVFAGIATQSASAGQNVVVRKQDFFSFSAWSWTPGEPVFALAGGALSQAAPDSGVLHQIGSAVDPVTILISPRDTIQL